MLKYGVFIGRFQPLHNGHLNIINHIKSLGYVPIILVGKSPNLDSKNPIPTREVLNALHNHLPYHNIKMIMDHQNNLTWINTLDNILSNVSKTDSFTLFTHNKPTEAGKYGLEEGQFYSDLILKHSIKITDVIDLTNTFSSFNGASATFIRALISKALSLAPKESIELLLKYK